MTVYASNCYIDTKGYVNIVISDHILIYRTLINITIQHVHSSQSFHVLNKSFTFCKITSFVTNKLLNK